MEKTYLAHLEEALELSVAVVEAKHEIFELLAFGLFEKELQRNLR